jgi:hypothetical protein
MLNVKMWKIENQVDLSSRCGFPMDSQFEQKI